MSELMTNSNKGLIKRTADVIAIEINSIKDQTKKILLASSIEIGRRLVEAKELIPHGEWEAWLERSVDYSKSTAKNLIRIFEEYGSEQITLLGDNAKSQAFGDLSYSQAVALLGIPADERETFIKENDIENMSTRELQQAIKEKKELEERLREAEEKAEAEHQALEKVNSSLKELEAINTKNKAASEKLKKELSETREKNKEEILNREVEIQNLKYHVDDIKKKLEAATSSGENDEEIENLQNALNEAEDKLHESSKRIEELEEQLKEKPIDVITAEPKVIEKVPDEIVKELQELREKVNNKEPSIDKAVVKFSVQFDALVKSFKELLGTLEEIESEELKGKYKNAVKRLIGKMSETL